MSKYFWLVSAETESIVICSAKINLLWRHNRVWVSIKLHYIYIYIYIYIYKFYELARDITNNLIVSFGNIYIYIYMCVCIYVCVCVCVCVCVSFWKERKFFSYMHLTSILIASLGMARHITASIHCWCQLYICVKSLALNGEKLLRQKTTVFNN